MTNAEQITVSLEWAKKLKEAGWPQEQPLHVWFRITAEGDWQCSFQNDGHGSRKVDGFMSENGHGFAAPTAVEILRRLPDQVVAYSGIYYLWVNRIIPYSDKWRIGYEAENSALVAKAENTLANAAAAMYVYLSENKLL